MKSIVCIPTYNEIDNVAAIIEAVQHAVDGIHVVIVDDGSPDGTGQLVKQLCLTNNRLHIIERAGKLGLGTAYCEAFQFALHKGFDRIVQMDADFSHNPNDLPKLLEYCNNFSVVIGSRYKHGVNVVNWPMKRLMLSYFANIYTKVITGMPLADSTGGFKCFDAAVLRNIRLASVKSNGYAFQIEMNFYAWRMGAAVIELPIVFTDRINGVSKMSKNIIIEAALLVWKLKLSSLFQRRGTNQQQQL
jgi:dolichol-phosphate mannosyltransferase